MTKDQQAAAASVRRALTKAHKVGLGLWVYEATAFMGPMPDMYEHPEWEGNPFKSFDDLGEIVSPIGMTCDGGSGSGRRYTPQ